MFPFQEARNTQQQWRKHLDLFNGGQGSFCCGGLFWRKMAFKSVAENSGFGFLWLVGFAEQFITFLEAPADCSHFEKGIFLDVYM